VAGDKGPPDRNDKPGTAPAASGAPLPPNAHGLERSRSAQRDDDTGSDDRESRNAEGKGQKVDEKSQPSTVGHAKGSDSGHLPVSNGAMATDYKAATDAYGKAGKLGRGK
jgi:hypothetical protein